MSSSTLAPIAVSLGRTDPDCRSARRRRTSFARVAAVLGLALFGGPLAFGGVEPWSAALLAGLVIVAVLCWALGCIRQRRIEFVTHPFCWTLLAFLLLGSVQYATHLTVSPVATRDAIIALLTYSLTFWVTIQLLAAASAGTWLRLGLGVTLYSFGLSLLGILQFFSSRGLIYWSVPANTSFGPYVNRDHFAGLMEMLIPFVAGYLLASPRQSSWRPIAAISLALSVTATLLSGSRSGMIALVLEGAVLLIFLMRRSSAPRRGGQAATIFAGLTVAILLFFWTDPGGISNRLAEVFQPQRSSGLKIEFRDRKQASLDSLRLWRSRPWLGAGLGSFETAYPPYKTIPDDLRWDHAQNDYAEALAETGLVGGVLILASIAFLGFCFLESWSEVTTSGSAWIRLGAAIGCCGILVHSFTDFNLHIPANATWFAFCAACGTLRLRSDAPRHWESR